MCKNLNITDNLVAKPVSLSPPPHFMTKILLCSPGQHGTYYVAQAGFKL